MISCFSCYLNPLTHHMSSSHFYETLIIGNFQKQNWKEKHSSLNCEGVDQIGQCHTGKQYFLLFIIQGGFLQQLMLISQFEIVLFYKLKGTGKIQSIQDPGSRLKYHAPFSSCQLCLEVKTYNLFINKREELDIHFLDRFKVINHNTNSNIALVLGSHMLSINI